MPLPGMPERPSVRQDFIVQPLNVLTTATPLIADQALGSSYIDSFILSVPSTAANSIFLGNQGVTAAAGGGIEITAGSSPNFAIDQGGRMLYELLVPLLKLSGIAECAAQMPEMLPFVCWDLSQVFVIAAANTPCSIGFFRNPFV